MAEASKNLTPSENKSSSPEPKRKDFLGIILSLFFLGNLGGLAYFGYSLKKISSQVNHLEVETQEASQRTPKSKKVEEAPHLGEEYKPKSIGPLLRMEPFLVNVPSENGTKFLQLQMEIELENDKVKDEVTKIQPKLRDQVITLLSSRQYQDLKRANGIRNLRQDLVQLFNKNLTDGKINTIYFTQFHFN